MKDILTQIYQKIYCVTNLWRSCGTVYLGIERERQVEGCPKIKYKTCEQKDSYSEEEQNEGKGIKSKSTANRDDG